MGLFAKKKNEAIEAEVLQKIQDSDLLNVLVYMVLHEPEFDWMKNGKPGKSSRRRVEVRPSGVIIEKPGAYEKRDWDNCFTFNFNDNGYSEIDAHMNERGKVDIGLHRMCYLYATAIQNRLRSALTDCVFDGKVSTDRNINELPGDGLLFFVGLALTDTGKYASFFYEVPVPKAKALF